MFSMPTSITCDFCFIMYYHSILLRDYMENISLHSCTMLQHFTQSSSMVLLALRTTETLQDYISNS